MLMATLLAEPHTSPLRAWHRGVEAATFCRTLSAQVFGRAEYVWKILALCWITHCVVRTQRGALRCHHIEIPCGVSRIFLSALRGEEMAKSAPLAEKYSRQDKGAWSLDPLSHQGKMREVSRARTN